MIRSKLLLMAVLLNAVLILPQTGLANKITLHDNELSEVIGQEGVGTETTNPINMHIDNTNVINNLVQLSDVDIKGSLTTRGPMANTTIEPEMTDLNLPGDGKINFGLKVLQSLGLGSQDFDKTINIDKLTVGGIRLGNDIKAPSFGSVYVDSMNMNLKGSTSVTPHF